MIGTRLDSDDLDDRSGTAVERPLVDRSDQFLRLMKVEAGQFGPQGFEVYQHFGIFRAACPIGQLQGSECFKEKKTTRFQTTDNMSVDLPP